MNNNTEQSEKMISIAPRFWAHLYYFWLNYRQNFNRSISCSHIILFPYPSTFIPPSNYPLISKFQFSEDLQKKKKKNQTRAQKHFTSVWRYSLKQLTGIKICKQCKKSIHNSLAKHRMSHPHSGKINTYLPKMGEMSIYWHVKYVKWKKESKRIVYLVFKGLDLIECLMNYGWRFVTLYRRPGPRPSPWKRNAKKQNGCLRRPYK